MKVGIIIPDRGDRGELTEFVLNKILEFAGRHDIFTALVNDKSFPAKDGICDITARYRYGYDILHKMQPEVIFMLENDDYYSHFYIARMLEAWEEAGRPDLFGTNQTLYYHIRLRKYFTMYHDQRSSAMNTMIKPNLNFSWPPDHDPYTDQWLWQQAKLSKALLTPKKIISLGIKGHGMGMTGGSMHEDDLYRYINDDANMEFLRDCLGDDKESFEFYRNLSNKLNNESKN